MIIYEKYRYTPDPNVPSTHTEFLTLEEAIYHKEQNGNVGEIHKLLKELVG